MNRPGRREAAIDPEEGPLQQFAHELRTLRRRSGGASFQDLARHTRQIGRPFSASTLRNAASGTVLPTAAVLDAFIRACLRHAGQHKGELDDRSVLDENADALAAGWTKRRDELAKELAEPVAEPVVPRRKSRRIAIPVVAGALAVLAVVAWIVFPVTEPGGTAAVPVTSLPPELSSGQCRGAFATPVVTVNPCVKATEAGLEIVVHVTAREAAPEIAIHLWLHDGTAKRRLQETLHYCQAAFTAAGQTAVCGPVTLRPEPGHMYSPAANAEVGTQNWPTPWRDPNTTGLTGPSVLWEG